MSQQIVVSLFDYSGNMVKPWADAGFLCYCVDVKHPAGENREGNIIRVGADVREWLPPYAKIAMLFAFPPCTHVAVSGARWFQDKGLGSLVEALQMFDATIRLAEVDGSAIHDRKPGQHYFHILAQTRFHFRSVRLRWVSESSR